MQSAYPYPYPYPSSPWHMTGGYFPGPAIHAGYIPHPFMPPKIKWEAPKEPEKANYVRVNVIYDGFKIPDEKKKFKVENNHFLVQPIQVDIANTSGNQVMLSFGGGEGWSLQEVFETGGEEWILGHSDIKFDSAVAKKACKEYGWARGNDSGKRHSTIWVVLKR